MLGVSQSAAEETRESLRGLLAFVSRDYEVPLDCPELDCLRDLLPPEVIDAAAHRARRVGTSAERVLISAGTIREEDYVRALAQWLKMPFESLTITRRDACPADDESLIKAPAGGTLLLRGKLGMAPVVAPHNASQFIQAMRNHPQLRELIRLTTTKHITDYVMRHIPSAIGERAANALPRDWPALSAAPPRTLVPFIIAGAVTAVAAVVAPVIAAYTLQLMLAFVFLSWVALRLLGLFITPASTTTSRQRDEQLPVYTVVAALYREASSVEQLVSAIRHLDYPPEKLDVKLVLEPDDHETRAAITRLDLPATFEVIVAPDVGPRTKPKALNVALPFARGRFVVVYDAEDRPEPGQLRCAIETFAAGDDRLGCLQARLTIDNTADGWLAAYFTAEYAGQFDVFLPGVAALRLPLPLGGSSNHFRTTMLRKLHGWDSYNVTEDADLGMRLARFGYHSGVIDSTTYEEAPSAIGPWLRQRTRWFKGWLQTWLVHMRSPIRLLRDLGPASFVAFQLMVVGNVLAALVHPVFFGLLIYGVVTGSLWSGDGIGTALMLAVVGTTAISGFVASVVLGCVGLARRGLLREAWVLLLTPIHWMLLSWAAWRALYQLIRDPYRWEKTEHGLARTSRLAGIDDVSRSALERLLEEVQPFINTDAIRLQPLPASA